MGTILDGFSTTMFTSVSLTKAINELPHVPNRIERMGLFQEEGVETTSVVVEEDNGTLALVPTKTRGTPASLNKHDLRTVRRLEIPHVPLEDQILAASIQNVRSFGSDSKLESVAEIVNKHLKKMKMKMDITLEHMRIGALQGNILDSDGSTVIYNLFTEFGVSETTQAFAFSVGGTEVQTVVLDVKRAIEDALGSMTYDHIHAFCGKDWFDSFISHASVQSAYERYQAGSFLRDDTRAGFNFAGCIFEEYRGSVGGVTFLPDAEARFFPVGVPDMYVTHYAPADFIETVNTVGKRVYAKQENISMNRGVKLHVQMNPLPIVTRPAALIKATST